MRQNHFVSANKECMLILRLITNSATSVIVMTIVFANIHGVLFNNNGELAGTWIIVNIKTTEIV
jgi:hypothetical protein